MEPGVGDAEEEEDDAVADEHAQQQQQHQEKQKQSQQEQQRQQEQKRQKQQPPSLRRRADEDGRAVVEMQSQIVSLSAHAETQAAAIRGIEQARVMGEQVVELKAEIKIKDAALQAAVQAKDAALQANDSVQQATVQARDVALQSKDALLHSKDAVIEAKTALLQAKDAIIVAKDAEIQRLRAELACCGAEAAVGGGARLAPAPARAAASAAAHAPAPAPAPAAIAVAAAAAAAAPPAASAVFHFSSRAEHKAADVLLSPDLLTATRTTNSGWAWARSERGVGAGCGVVRWAVQLSRERALVSIFRVGVSSDALREFSGSCPNHLWFIQNNCSVASRHQQGAMKQQSAYFDSLAFAAGDIVTVELERAPGVDGVLRVRVAGKTARKLRGLPRDGMLYPIVGLDHKQQSYTMVALP